MTPLSCAEAGPVLSGLLDGEISAAERAEVETHLAACASCRSELESLHTLRGLLAVETPTDPSFVARFRVRRDEAWGAPGLVSWRRLAVRLMPLAAAALLGAGAFVWLSSMEESEALVELEAKELGSSLPASGAEDATVEGVLRIAIEPFPGEER